MAYGLSEITQNGVDYRINDPNIANEFSASTAYSSGTYVNYNGLLYRFTTDHPAGAWNASHVSAVKVGDKIAYLKSALNELDKNVFVEVKRTLPAFYIGTYWHQTAGRYYTNTARARSSSLVNNRKAITFTNPNYRYWITGYSGSSANQNTFIREITFGATEAGVITVIPQDIPVIALTVETIDGSTIPESANSEIVAGFKFFNTTDETNGKTIYTSNDEISLIPSSSNVFALYDELVNTYSDFVTKNTLTSDSFTNYEYVFSTGNYNEDPGSRSPDDEMKKPVVLIISGVHGYERSSVMSLYGLLKSLCENEYTLTKIKEYMILKVIPIVCPWGYDNDSRVNANGVNINRNFNTTNWVLTETGSDYSGASPGDQNETKIVQNWILSNNDAYAFIDWHNSSYVNEISCLLGTKALESDTIKKYFLLSENQVIPHWQKKREINTDNVYAYTGQATINGGSCIFSSENGIPGVILETSWNIISSGKHSNFTIGTGQEVMGNFLTGLIDEKINIVNEKVDVIDERIDSFSDGVLNTLGNEQESLTWGQGSINGNTGVNQTSSNRIRAAGFHNYDNVANVSVFCPDGYKIGIREFASNTNPQQDHFIGSIPNGEAFVKHNVDFIPVEGHYYRYVIGKIDDSDILPADAPIGFKIVLLTSVNDTFNDTFEQITELGERIDYIDNSLSEEESLTWGQGGINGNTGVNQSLTNRIRSAGFQNYDDTSVVKVFCPAGYKIGVREFTSDQNPQQNYFVQSIPNGEAFVSQDIMFVPTDEHYYRYVLGKADDSDILPADVPVDFKVNLLINVNDINNQISEITENLNFINENLPSEAETLTWGEGGINGNTGVNQSLTNRIRSSGFQNYDGKISISVICPSGYKIGIREFSSNTNPQQDYFIGSIPNGEAFVTRDVDFIPVEGHYYRYVIGKTDDSDILPADVPVDFKVIIGNSLTINVESELKLKAISYMYTSNVGNVGILCAKEHHYIDGSSPICEWYLLGDPATNDVFYSKDLKTKIKLFTFPDRVGYWSFGIDANNNIICCKQSEYLSNSLTHDDGVRVNPIVYLSSEKYNKPHTVNFGSSLKPCGWLSNVGFICLENGDCLISEYTRPTVQTAHVWKISGDPSVSSNWSDKKSFDLSGNNDGFKHIHCVQQDFYTGVCYFGTGDDDTSSHIYYSLDNGDTWTVGKENNEKYCRLLNIIFTEEWCYWSTDSNKPNYHFIFKAPRLASGVIDFNNITDLLEIPLISGLATYGCVYLPIFEALLLLERTDGSIVTEAPVRLYDISTNTLHTVYTLKSVSESGGNLGFRTRFADWYPKDNKTNLSWHLRGTSIGSTGFNPNKMFGNQAVGTTEYDINNAVLTINKNGSDYKMTIGTRYI